MAQTIDYRDHFYEDKYKFELPVLVESILERVIIYFAELLYPNIYSIDPQEAINRILISDVEAGGNVASGDGIEYFRAINHKYPFTVYNIGDFEYRFTEFNNQHAALGLQYFPEIEAKIRTYPNKLNLLFLTFYNKAIDYHAGITLLGSESSSLTRLYVPVLFGDLEVSLPIDLQYTLQRGTYSSKFEDYLVQNKLWDIVHNVEIDFYEYILDGVTLGKVDNILVRLGGDTPLKVPGEFGSNNVPDNLSVESTFPVKESINVAKNSVISFTFSEPVVFDNFSFTSNIYFDYDLVWESSSIVSITPRDDLQAEKEYILTVSKNTTNADGVGMLEDYVLNFFTEV